MADEKLARLRELLKTESKDTLRAECASLLASGVEYKAIVRTILSLASNCSADDPSWLPAASVINLSDSLVHVALQLPKNKPKLMVFGERTPDFRRIERSPLIAGTIEALQARFNEAAIGNDVLLAERCLLSISERAGIATAFETIFNCLLQPRYLGQTTGAWWAGVRHLSIGCMIDLWQEFGNDAMLEIACYIGAKQCTKRLTDQNEETARATDELTKHYRELQTEPENEGTLDEADFRRRASSGNIQNALSAIAAAWQSGVSVEQLDVALTMLCVERLLRGGFGHNPNWDNLKRELQATGVIRRANVISKRLAYKAAMHAVWQIVRHGDEGLADEIPDLITSPIRCEAEQIGYVINGIAMTSSREAIQKANNFIASGHAPEHLMRDTILWVNEKCVGGGYYAGQRGMIDAWHLAKDHSERNRIPQALAGWMADYRNQHFKHQKFHSPIWGASLSDDGQLAAFRSGGTRVFDTITGKELVFFRGTPWRFAFHPGGRCLACGWEDSTIQIIDMLSRDIVKEWSAFTSGNIWGLAFSPDGTMLAATSGVSDKVRIWDSETWDLAFELSGHTNNHVESVTFSADNQTIATGGCDGTVRLWDAATGESIRVFDKHTAPDGRITGLQFHPDGERMVSAQCDGEVKIWNRHTGKEQTTFAVPGWCSYSGFTPNGQLAISEHKGTLHYRDVDTGKLLYELAAIGGANQSRDRSTLITYGWAGEVGIWDAVTRKSLQSFKLSFDN